MLTDLAFYEDSIFKKVFSKDNEILLDLLNSLPQFQGSDRIKKVKILNPEILGTKKNIKNTILDIHAEDISNRKFLIEMQTNSHEGFSQRILFNWSKLYSTSLEKGETYKELPKVYSINFLKFSLIKNQTDYISSFKILEEKHHEICLTKDLEIIIIELPKLKKEFHELNSILEYWIYLIRESPNLKEAEMKTIMKKSNGLNKAIKEIKFIYLDEESRKLHAARLNAERKYKKDLYEKGIEEGIEMEKFKTSLVLREFGMPIEKISKITGLSQKQILDYKNKVSKKK